MKTGAALLLSLLTSLGGPPRLAAPELLTPLTAIELPGVLGRIDHLALDSAGRRLFVAALGNGTVEVVDLARGRPAGRIGGLAEPQGVVFLPAAGLLAVSEGGAGTIDFFAAANLERRRRVRVGEDADNLRYDAASRRLWVAFGGGDRGGLAALDPLAGTVVATIPLPGHAEAFEITADGSRAYVNVPRVSEVEAVDLRAGKVTVRWPLRPPCSNFPLALDEAHHRLLVGCRRPADIRVLDTTTGRSVATLAGVGDVDDLFFDGPSGRLYASGGQGAITIFGRSGKGGYRRLGEVRTAPGARTSLLARQAGRLYVAAPRRAGRPAAVLVFGFPSGEGGPLAGGR